MCDVTGQNGDREEPSWRRQYVSLDVCSQMTPSLCLKDRTVPKTAMDSDVRASTKEEAGSANPTEVRTLASSGKQTDAYLATSGTRRQPQHTGLSGNLRPDSQRAGLRMGTKSTKRLAGGGGNNPQRSPATTWQQKWRTQPSIAAVQLGKIEPTQQSLPQQHRELPGVHSRRSSITIPRDFCLAKQCIHITSFFYAHIVHILMHTPNHHYTHTLCIHTRMRVYLYAYTSFYMHTHPMTLS